MDLVQRCVGRYRDVPPNPGHDTVEFDGQEIDAGPGGSMARKAGEPQHFLYLPPEPHQQGPIARRRPRDRIATGLVVPTGVRQASLPVDRVLALPLGVRDPLNALLSFCYSMLTKDLVAVTLGVGLILISVYTIVPDMAGHPWPLISPRSFGP